MATKVLMNDILSKLNNKISDDIKYTLKDGVFHSYDDKPAFETKTGIQAWFLNGKLHRDTKDPETGLTLPAFIKKGNGVNETLLEWWFEDTQHRNDIDPVTKKSLPAEIFIYGDSSYKCWRTNGKIHRDSTEGPAYINRYCETYMEEGVPHRDQDLPAVISSDKRELEWWVKGVRHRDTLDEDGNLLPAVMRIKGVEFWKNGVKLV